MGRQGDKELRSFQITLKYIIKSSTAEEAQLLLLHIKIHLPSSGTTGGYEKVTTETYVINVKKTSSDL